MKALFLYRFAIQRLGVIPVASELKEQTDPFMVPAMQAEFAQFGYTIDTGSDLLQSVTTDEYKAIINVMKELKGADVEYVPLFQGFPDEIPDDNVYLAKRICGFFLAYTGLTSLDDAASILFDTSQFGANPITQMQDEESFRAGVEEQKSRIGDRTMQQHGLRVVDRETFHELMNQWVQDSMYASTSVKENVLEDIAQLLKSYPHIQLNLGKVGFKENLAYLLKDLWKFNPSYAISFADTPTDVLRLFASATDSDVALIEDIKFPKLSRKLRRKVLDKLNDCSSLAEDLNRYRDLWLAVMKGLHPFEYKDRYPDAAHGFSLLADDKVRSWNSYYDQYLNELQSEKMGRDPNMVWNSLIDLLQSRPSMFARNLNELTRKLPTRYIASMCKGFEDVGDKVAFKILLQLSAYFSTPEKELKNIFEDKDVRAFINKSGTIKVIEDNRKPLTDDRRRTVFVEGILPAIRKYLEIHQEQDWEGKRVYIDQRLEKVLLPLHQRKQSDGLLNFERGTRVPLDLDGKVLRLFTYWKQKNYRTDFDLSVIAFDKDFKPLGQVSYTNLIEEGIRHSGDIQSAPHGASEFIDIDPTSLGKGVHYIAMQIFKYSGESFDEVEQAHAGWMIRNEVSSDIKSYDPKTVHNKFDLATHASYAQPIFVDVKNNELIYVDLYVNGRNLHNRNEGALDSIQNVLRGMVQISKQSPTVFELALLHTIHRGAGITADKEVADIVFDYDDPEADYSAQDTAKLLTLID